MDGVDEIPNHENAPLLNTQLDLKRQRTPLPWLQITIMLLLHTCEPISSQSIYPYINEVYILFLFPAVLLIFLGKARWEARHYRWRWTKDRVLCWVYRWVYFFCAKRDEASTNRYRAPFLVGVLIFRDRGYHHLPMESNIRSYWKKASPHVWDGRNDFIHVVLWIVSYILYPCD